MSSWPRRTRSAASPVGTCAGCRPRPSGRRSSAPETNRARRAPSRAAPHGRRAAGCARCTTCAGTGPATPSGPRTPAGRPSTPGLSRRPWRRSSRSAALRWPRYASRSPAPRAPDPTHKAGPRRTGVLPTTLRRAHERQAEQRPGGRPMRMTWEQGTALMRAAALDYAASGQPVFPVHPAGPEVKRPIVRWRTRATTDPEQIERWWSAVPYAIGLSTGVLVDVLDIDRKPGRPNGYAVMRMLDALGMLDGVARWTKTPSGGRHAYFPASPDMP